MLLFAACLLFACAEGKIVDLTHLINKDIPDIYHEGFQVTETADGLVELGNNAKAWMLKRNFCMIPACGTHILTPSFLNGGATDLEFIKLRATRVNFRAEASRNSSVRIGEEWIRQWETKNGKPEAGQLIILDSGWASLWNSKYTYLGHGIYSSQWRFPGIDSSTAKWIVSNWSPKAVAIDTAAIDGDVINDKALSILAKANLPVIVNLNTNNYGDFSEKEDVRVFVIPAKLKKSAILPARIVAFQDEPRFRDGDKIKWVDIGRGWNNGPSVTWPDVAEKLTFKPLQITGPNDRSVDTMRICSSEHSGTHLDAPRYALDQEPSAQWTIDEIPVERLLGVPVVLLKVGKLAKRFVVTSSWLKTWEKFNGRIPKGSAVILYTSASKYYPNETALFTTDNTQRFGGFTPESIDFLTTKRSVVALATDAPSIDLTNTLDAMRAAFKSNAYVLTNLVGLDSLSREEIRLFAFPLPFEGAAGSPVRVLARVGPKAYRVVNSPSSTGNDARTISGVALPILVFVFVLC